MSKRIGFLTEKADTIRLFCMRVNVPWDDWKKHLQQGHYPASFHLFNHKKPFEEGEDIHSGDLRDAVYFKESEFGASLPKIELKWFYHIDEMGNFECAFMGDSKTFAVLQSADDSKLLTRILEDTLFALPRNSVVGPILRQSFRIGL